MGGSKHFYVVYSEIIFLRVEISPKRARSHTRVFPSVFNSLRFCVQKKFFFLSWETERCIFTTDQSTRLADTTTRKGEREKIRLCKMQSANTPRCRYKTTYKMRKLCKATLHLRTATQTKKKEMNLQGFAVTNRGGSRAALFLFFFFGRLDLESSRSPLRFLPPPSSSTTQFGARAGLFSESRIRFPI